MTGEPEPFTPAHVDLRGVKWMPLFGRRMLKSEAWVNATREARAVMIQFWWEAWDNCPAASLPSDEKTLMATAGITDVRIWERVKGPALHGFVLCSDGRLHHRFLADEAAVVFKQRDASAARSAKSRERQRVRSCGSESDRTRTGLETAAVSSRDCDEKPRETSAVTPAVTRDVSAHPTTPDRKKKIQGSPVAIPVEVDGPDAPGPGEDAVTLPTDGRLAFDAYNALARRLGFPVARKLDEAKLKKMRARIRDAGGLDGWYAALARVEASSFLRGERSQPGHEGWSVDLDFLLQASKFSRLLDGAYDDRTPKRRAGPGGLPQGRMNEQLGRLMVRRGVDLDALGGTGTG